MRHPKGTYVIGCDVGRFGDDETAIIVLERLIANDNIRVVYIETIPQSNLTHVIGRLKYLDSQLNTQKILIDETGLGAGVVDSLKEELKYKIEGITFTQKSKAELFYNLKLLMEKGKLKIPLVDNNNPATKKLIYQFMSINKESSSNGVPKFSHEKKSHDDTICALALAAWYFKAGGPSKQRTYGLA